jgi:outer membrane protein assembly factor BamB
MTDEIDSVPAIGADGTVYVGSWSGNLAAINPNGTRKWEYSTGAYIVSSPAIGADGTIYFGAGDFGLSALNPDGTLRWRFVTGDWVDSSPAIGRDGTVYVGSWDGSLYAVNPDGSLAWSYQTGSQILSSPAIGADGTVYVGSSDQKLYAFAPDGTKLWEFLTGDAIEGSPVVDADGTVYIGSTDGGLYALTPAGALKWTYTSTASLVSTPALRAGSLVIGTSANTIVCLATVDGHQLWSVATGDWVDSCPVIAPGGNIYVGCLDAKLYALAGNGQVANPGAPWPMFHHDLTRQGLLTAAPVAQTVTFNGPGDQAFSFAPLTLAASASSGLPVSFSIVTGPATVNGSTLTLIGSGTVTVRASQPGDANHSAAPNVDRSFNVSPDYASWQQSKFTGSELSDPTKSGPTAVYGHDGLPNLVKYALGLDPKVDATGSVLPVAGVTATDWIYTYARPTAITDVTYAVEVSTDLVNWTAAGVTLELVSSDGTTDTWRGRYPRGGPNTVFFHLKVVQ